MIQALRKIWQFAGEESRQINGSVILGFFFAVFHMFQVGAIYYVVVALTEKDETMQAAWTAFIC